ncbi:hypothetical protein CF8_3139 [Nocardioides sp. CF8]|nr:hypothetical protein CF8_3139 [Nocardioides sp. CF8]
MARTSALPLRAAPARRGRPGRRGEGGGRLLGRDPRDRVAGETTFTTAMFPSEGTYFLPLKDAVRRAEGVGPGDVVEVRLSVGR